MKFAINAIIIRAITIIKPALDTLSRKRCRLANLTLSGLGSLSKSCLVSFSAGGIIAISSLNHVFLLEHFHQIQDRFILGFTNAYVMSTNRFTKT